MASTSQNSPTKIRAYVTAVAAQSNKLTPATPTLEGLPLELLHKIFNYVVDDEQSVDRELTGSSTDQNATCLPIATLRPPPLIRTSRLLRHAYLPYFFANTTFRIPARVDRRIFTHHWQFGGISGSYLNPLLSPPTFAWLASLRSNPLASTPCPKFRHIQLRPVISGVATFGLTVDIDFNPRTRSYTIRNRFDEGFVSGPELEARDVQFSGGMTLWGPQNCALILAKACQFKREEVLDLELVDELERVFRVERLEPLERDPQLKRYMAGRLEEWGHEIKLLN